MKLRNLLSAIMLLAVASTSVQAQSKAVPVIETNTFEDNWFIGAGVGALLYFGENETTGGLGDRIAPAFSLSLGKWITPNFAFRFEYSGFQARGYTPDIDGVGAYGEKNSDGLYQQKFRLSSFHVDAMVNVMNLFGGYRDDRFYRLLPYAGFGVARNGTNKIDEFAFTAGLKNSFAISDALDFNADIKGTVAKDRLDGETAGFPGEGFLTVSFGVTYKFKPRGWKVYKPVAPVKPAPVAPVVPVVTPEPVVVVEEVVVNVKEAIFSSGVVFFDLGSSELSFEGRVTLSSVADVIRKDETGRIFTIIGYADNATGSDAVNSEVSEKRAEAVLRSLVYEFKVPESRLKIEYKGGVDNMYFNDPALSRIVVVE
ncbi:MAG: OmpA family protein [Rikenellaceae bacterium]